MKAERRHELKENDLAHALEVARKYLDEHGKRIGFTVVVVVAVVAGVGLTVRSRAAAGEDMRRRRGALKFDGVNDRVTVGAADIPPPWTAAMWVHREDSPGGAAKLLAAQSMNRTLRLEQWYNTNKVGFSGDGVMDSWTYDYEVAVGTWVHLVFICTGSETALVVNGVPEDTRPAAIDLPIYFIGTQTTDHTAKGLIDDIRVYSRVLTPSELQALATMGD